MNDDGERYALYVVIMFLMLFVVESMAQLIGVLVKVSTPPTASCDGLRSNPTGPSLAREARVVAQPLPYFRVHLEPLPKGSLSHDCTNVFL